MIKKIIYLTVHIKKKGWFSFENRRFHHYILYYENKNLNNLKYDL